MSADLKLFIVLFLYVIFLGDAFAVLVLPVVHHFLQGYDSCLIFLLQALQQNLVFLFELIQSSFILFFYDIKLPLSFTAIK